MSSISRQSAAGTEDDNFKTQVNVFNQENKKPKPVLALVSAICSRTLISVRVF